MSGSLYSLSRKEGWRRYVEAPARERPGQLPPGQLRQLGDTAREQYDEARHDWHANFGILRTPQLAAVHGELEVIVAAGRCDPDRVRGAAVIDALPGLGKTTAVNSFARGFDRDQIRRHGPLTGQGHERIPVFRAGLTSNTTLRTLNRMICQFYGHPGAGRASAAQLASQAVDCVLSCESGVGIIDDLHFIDPRRKDGLDVSNHLKWLANELPVTFLYAGVGLAGRGLFAEGLTGHNAALAQTGRRWTRLELPPFEIVSDQGRRDWQGLLKATERQLVLARARPGMLTQLADYLFERTSGHIGSFITLITRGCVTAIRSGQEDLTAALLDRVRIDEASEQARRQLAAAFTAGRLSATPAARGQTAGRRLVRGPDRTLPLRVPPVPGEAIDSWLEALARRNQVSVGTLTAALGWPLPASPGGLVAGIPGQVLRRLEHQAGLAAGRLDDTVLDRYLPLGPVRRRGSRYCPSCLAERDGRWLLSWRLGWVFACTTHDVLLCDTCPACRQAPRARAGRAGLNPPGSCPNTIKRHEYCGADLREVPPQPLPAGHPALAAQRWTGTLLTFDDYRPAGNGVALGDLGIVGSWVLRQAPAALAQFAGLGPAALAAWHEWNQQTLAVRRQPGRSPPASAALTAALAATAMTVLTGSDEQAIAQIRALLPPRAGPRRPRPAGLPAPRWLQLSQPARGRFLRALDPDLGPADRIRYRTGTPQARIPADPPGLLAARARAIPQLLWPEWAIRLMPARGFAAGPFRGTVAACLLLPGQPGRATGTAITGLHGYRSALATGTVLRALAGGGHDTVLTAISCLAGYLDSYGSPIDYQRRRDLIPAGTIITSQWRDLCYGAAAHPGEARRHRDAQRYLFQLLTGADLHDPRHALAFTTGNDYSHYQAFAGTLPTGLRDALHGHATGLLHDLGIGEPLTWAPPPGCCARLTLPGPEPDDIDLDAAGRLIITEKLPVTGAAARLGTTTGHVRLALEHLPRPARQWGRSAAPPTWQRQQHARAILTREFFEREYIAAGKNLRQLEAETGIPRRFLTQVAREHGITMTGVRGPAPAGPCPLPGHHLTGQRPGSGSPAGPAGPGDQIPGDIRRAAGDSPAGWHRLRRFQIAMASPTIAAAAAGLRICPSALSHQLRRLEGDIGAKLYQPATSRRPWRPTRRGAALLTALARPGIQALAAAHAPDVSGPGRSRYRDRLPITLGPDAAAARQAASLFRELANPTRLAILLTLQTAEQRITDLAAQLGGSQANISAHLIRLRKAGLITSRQTQGRAVYYRLAQPKLGDLLQAAGQLLGPAGQQAAEENDTTVRKTQPTNR